MAEPTPVEELHAAAKTLLSNPQFGGIPWISLAPPEVVGTLASLMADVAESVEQDGGVVETSTEDTALILARAINAKREGNHG